MTDIYSADRTDLFNRARQGDMDALGSLLKSFRNNLRMLASVRNDKDLRRKIDTSDVLQEIEMQAIGDFPSFRGESIGELLNWLRQILKTKLAKAKRSYWTQKRNVHLEQDLNADGENSDDAVASIAQDDGTQPLERLIQLETALKLFDTLKNLPDAQQEVVNMYYFEGLTMQKAGERIGKTENAVQKIWTRALANLGKRLNQDNPMDQ